MTKELTEPTPEQRKEFWELCGLTYKTQKFGVSSSCEAMYIEASRSEEDYSAWFSPEGKLISFKLPKIDLNNLEPYAFPKVNSLDIEKRGDVYYCVIWENTALSTILSSSENKELRLALFWALFKVLRGEK